MGIWKIMNKAPFFISAPRTRSSVLFETAQYYVQKKFNLKDLIGHTELFLEFSRNAEFHDAKIGQMYAAELYPLARQGKLEVHYIYPPVFTSRKERNAHKIQTLKYLKDQGHQFNIKGTAQIIDSYQEIIDFYNDRHFVITKRRNLEDYVLSFCVAYFTKIFHARENNYQRYMDILDSKVYIPHDQFDMSLKLLKTTKQLWDLEYYLQEKGLSYSVTYYEDLDTQDKIDNTLTEILGTDDWKNYLPDDYQKQIPIKVDKVYRELISNYDEFSPVLQQHIKESGLG